MNKLLFGISGLPIGDGTEKFNYTSGINYLKSIGLDAMELVFVHSVNVTDKNKEPILRTKLEKDFYLSAHGSYYINLNAEDLEIQEKSLERIIKGANALSKVQGRSIIFHAGFYLNASKEEAFYTVKENLARLPYFGVDYRLETTGKGTQFGTLEELTQLCKEVRNCKLCVDFAHIHARNNGSLKNYDDFAGILQYISDELGREALDDMHMHIAGINYSVKGEKNHLPFEESDFNYVECLRAIKDFQVKGCLVCESPLLEKDALLLKSTYHKL